MKEFLKIKYVVDMKVLFEFIQLSNNPNTLHFGLFSLVAYHRKCICDSIGIKGSVLSLSTKRLKELGIIRGSGGFYQISYEIMKHFKVLNIDKRYYTFEDISSYSLEEYDQMRLQESLERKAKRDKLKSNINPIKLTK